GEREREGGRVARDRGGTHGKQLAVSERTGKYCSVHAACCQDLFQLFRPVNDNSQTASVRAAQHDEPSVVAHTVIRDRHVLTEVVFINEQSPRFSESGFGPGCVESDSHHMLAAAIENLSTSAAPRRLHTT